VGPRKMEAFGKRKKMRFDADGSSASMQPRPSRMLDAAEGSVEKEGGTSEREGSSEP